MISYSIGIITAMIGIWIFNPALVIIGLAITLPTVTKHLSEGDNDA